MCNKIFLCFRASNFPSESSDLRIQQLSLAGKAIDGDVTAPRTLLPSWSNPPASIATNRCGRMCQGLLKGEDRRDQKNPSPF